MKIIFNNKKWMPHERAKVTKIEESIFSVKNR